ncbi:hypothetical protein ACSSS7_002812 [Eimeria intestinalis]
MPPPAKAKAVQRFLGNCQCNCVLIPHFSIIAAPLFQAAARTRDFNWTPEAKAAWRALCQSLSTDPSSSTQTTHCPSTSTAAARATASARSSCSPRRTAGMSLPTPPGPYTTTEEMDGHRTRGRGRHLGPRCCDNLDSLSC